MTSEQSRAVAIALGASIRLFAVILALAAWFLASLAGWADHHTSNGGPAWQRAAVSWGAVGALVLVLVSLVPTRVARVLATVALAISVVAVVGAFTLP